MEGREFGVAFLDDKGSERQPDGYVVSRVVSRQGSCGDGNFNIRRHGQYIK